MATWQDKFKASGSIEQNARILQPLTELAGLTVCFAGLYLWRVCQKLQLSSVNHWYTKNQSGI